MLAITVDSGASDSIGPEGIAPGVEVRETAASKAGVQYTVANGHKIPNKGEKDVPMVTEEGDEASMTFQIADVHKALGSVRRICEAGNRVVFDEEGSYIENKATGKRTKMEKKGGVYVLKVKVLRKKDLNHVSETGGNGSSSSNAGFLRLVDLI